MGISIPFHLKGKGVPGNKNTIVNKIAEKAKVSCQEPVESRPGITASLLQDRLLGIHLSNSTERFTPHMSEVLLCKIYLSPPSCVQFYFASSNLSALSVYYQNLTLLLYRKRLFNI